MNKELFDSMQKQMNPNPEVREALAEKLAQPAKRRTPVRKYVAVAACAALVIGGFSVYKLYQDHEKWILVTQNFERGANIQNLHSYVIVEDTTGYTTENTGALSAENGTEEVYQAGVLDRGSGTSDIVDLPGSIVPTENYQTGLVDRDLAPPNTGDLSRPEGAIEDVPVQEGAEDYQLLMAHFNGTLPDWYGGGYLDDTGRLMVLLVDSQDPGDKSLELQIQEWTGSSRVSFGSAKYSLKYLNGLMDQLNRLPDTDLKYADVMAGWGIDEERNRVELTLTQVYEPLLSVLAKLDPDDDAIYVQVGRRAAAYAGVEDSALIMPGGAVRDEDQDLIAYEPYYDGSDYDVERLPEEGEKRPAINVQSVPEEEDRDPLTAVTYDVETGEITTHPYPYSEGSEKNASRSTAPFNPDR